MCTFVAVFAIDGILCVFRQFQYPKPSGSLAEPQG